MTFAFHVEWETPPRSVRSDEIRATWARLEVVANGRCLTQADDKDTRSVRRSISVSLYPLAEWIAYNWWLLASDSRKPLANGRIDRRNMRSAGDGFVWPNIEFVPTGSVTLVSARAVEPLEGQSLRFQGSEEFWVDSAELRKAFSGLVDMVIRRLDTEKVFGSHLVEEWKRLAALDQDEATFCEIAARLGLDPFSEGIDIAESIEEAFSLLEPDVMGDFFDAVATSSFKNDAEWVGETLVAIRADGVVSNDDQFAVVASSINEERVRHPNSSPSEVGYAGARKARERLEVAAGERVGDIPGRVVSAQPNTTFAGAGLVLSGHSPLTAIPRDAPPNRLRFTSARALWHGSIPKGGAFLLSKSSAVMQQAGRAFAAEFLAPAEGLELLVEKFGPDGLEELAGHYGVSTWVIDYQIRNHRLW